MRNLLYFLLVANAAMALWLWADAPTKERSSPSRTMVAGLRQLEVTSSADTPEDTSGTFIRTTDAIATESVTDADEPSDRQVNDATRTDISGQTQSQQTPRDASDAVSADTGLSAPVADAPQESSQVQTAVEPSGASIKQCLRMGPITVQSAAVDLVSALQADYDKVVLTREQLDDSAVLWVHIPPLASKEDADTAVDRLSARGIESFRIDAPERLKNGVSLGVFRVMERAQQAVEGFAGLGYPVAIDERSRTTEHYWITAMIMIESDDQAQRALDNLAEFAGEITYDLGECVIAEAEGDD